MGGLSTDHGRTKICVYVELQQEAEHDQPKLCHDDSCVIKATHPPEYPKYRIEPTQTKENLATAILGRPPEVSMNSENGREAHESAKF